mmetsp:Transcript_17734/g.35402  ORF Transcript_17734/g.35402 Transcript_17734/m.35402 type:complete len:266 (-) Transcript_17734:421-1218(-)
MPSSLEGRGTSVQPSPSPAMHDILPHLKDDVVCPAPPSSSSAVRLFASPSPARAPPHPPRSPSASAGDVRLLRSHHASLFGTDRLRNVVACLGQNCPWTAGVGAAEMASWLEGEIGELREEIAREDTGEAAARKRIVSEMGDILFDAYMLEMICRRDYDLSDLPPAWQVAAEKVERRTPYMAEWGDGGVTADTAEEAERLWRAAKRREAGAETGRGSRKKKIDSDRSFRRDRLCDVVLTRAAIISTGACGVILGFVMGTALSRRK